jgi:hypothetical protein
MNYQVVITCNRPIWDAYGRKAAEAFLEFWPALSCAQLVLYAEDFEPEQRFQAATVDRRMVIRELPEWHAEFKRRHAGNLDAHGRGPSARGKKDAYDYRRDCVRFSHKVAALTDAAERSPGGGVLVMMDADVISTGYVSPTWLELVFPKLADMAWLARAGTYPECGFVMFRESAARVQAVLAQLREVYESDRVFSMRETHDSFVLQQLVKLSGMVPHNWTRPGADRGNPFITSPLAEKMTHYKGKRKAEVSTCC